MHFTTNGARAAALLLALSAGCSRSDSSGAKEVARTAATADTGNALGATPAEGGVAKVTAADARSVTQATEFKLTPENFKQFVTSTDSVVALRARDSQVRDFLDKDITDAGSGTSVEVMNAGRTRLESNPAVSAAITSSGMSVRDYFVAAIAIAQAERFINDPKAAPPTPTTGPNAEFLRSHMADLKALRTRQNGAIIVR